MLGTFPGCALYMSGFYIPFVYLATGLQRKTGAASVISMSGTLSLITIALLLMALLNLVAWMLADRIGARRLLIVSEASMSLIAVPIFRWMESDTPLAIISSFIFLAVVFAPINAVGGLPLVLQFSPEVPGTAFSIGFNVAAVTFGGLSPLLADLVVRRMGMLSASGVLLVFAAVASIWAWATVKPKVSLIKQPIAHLTRSLPANQ